MRAYTHPITLKAACGQHLGCDQDIFGRHIDLLGLEVVEVVVQR